MGAKHLSAVKFAKLYGAFEMLNNGEEVVHRFGKK
ncbi:hypothetical protein FHW74_003521 [Atlantibacter sp. RC6]|nr:hypothetical protein [Atlantibacter sp. RC6]